MKQLLLALLFIFTIALATEAQNPITFFPLPDISGTGSAVALGTGTAHLCQLVSPSTNTNHIRWGDSTVTSSQGADMAPGSGQFLPPGPDSSSGGRGYVFDISKIFVLVQSGDKLTITCAK